MLLLAPGENQALAVKAGAIDALVAAMRAHVGNADVTRQVCNAITIFCVTNGAIHRCVLA